MGEEKARFCIRTKDESDQGHGFLNQISLKRRVAERSQPHRPGQPGRASTTVELVCWYREQ